jgi:hypothetical protein
MDASVAEEQEQHPSSLIPRSSSPNQKESRVYYLEKRKQCANCYFEVFHDFWPFIHKATFDVHQETPLLLQSIVAIGMWTSGERSTQSAAVELHDSLDFAIRDQTVRRIKTLGYTRFANVQTIGEMGCLRSRGGM